LTSSGVEAARKADDEACGFGEGAADGKTEGAEAAAAGQGKGGTAEGLEDRSETRWELQGGSECGGEHGRRRKRARVGRAELEQPAHGAVGAQANSRPATRIHANDDDDGDKDQGGAVMGADSDSTTDANLAETLAPLAETLAPQLPWTKQGTK
jgi:hypothetical protein